ncbi:hypothetical protein PVAP13_2KG172700 [Panicum virgatum]|uniref:Uncharacterized protein n=1 Tax=Panicum virgatum TaxID=38727 RepID=A0A8T0W9I4_PANVG|nr:hypothetical protein PVAP13_2KG172700 [Panicum virgatum]
MRANGWSAWCLVPGVRWVSFPQAHGSFRPCRGVVLASRRPELRSGDNGRAPSRHRGSQQRILSLRRLIALPYLSHPLYYSSSHGSEDDPSKIPRIRRRVSNPGPILTSVSGWNSGCKFLVCRERGYDGMQLLILTGTKQALITGPKSR